MEIGNDRRLTILVLAISLVAGLCYVFIVPPWMHYDEPNHFEYAYLLAKLNRQPVEGEYDPQMRLAVVESELETGFYRVLSLTPPDLEHAQQPLWIGPASQLDDPPLYYAWAGLPLRLFPGANVTTQLYLARLMSLPLYLLIIWLVQRTAAELAPARHPLRYALPLGVALLPGFVDVMTGVSNDVAVVAMVSVAVWGIVRLMVRGFDWRTAGLSLAGGMLTLWIKTSGLFVLPFLGLAILLSVLKPRLHWLVWGALAAAGALGLLLGLQWQDAFGWYRASSQAEAGRTAVAQAAAGSFAFQVNLAAPNFPPWNPPFFQPIPPQGSWYASQPNYSVGAWMWADRPLRANLPVLWARRKIFIRQVNLDVTPRFFAYTATLPLDQLMIPFHVDLNPRTKTATTGIVFVDGLVVAEGIYSTTEAPVFADPEASRGDWGGKSFTNLARNASAEDAGPRLRSQFDVPLAKLLPNQITPSLSLMSLLDRQGSWWFISITAIYDFRTFWAQFGWGATPLLGSRPYWFFLALTLLGLGGSLWVLALRLFKRSEPFPWELALVLTLFLALNWGLTLIRGISLLGADKLYFSPARYAYPAIFPAVLGLLGGWSAGVATLQKRLSGRRWLGYIILLLPLLAINFWALFSIAKFMEV